MAAPATSHQPNPLITPYKMGPFNLSHRYLLSQPPSHTSFSNQLLQFFSSFFQSCLGAAHQTEILQQRSTNPRRSLLFSENLQRRPSHCRSYRSFRHRSRVFITLILILSCLHLHLYLYLHPEGSRTRLAYGRKSKWKHGNPSSKLFTPKAVSFFVRFGMLEEFQIQVCLFSIFKMSSSFFHG